MIRIRDLSLPPDGDMARLVQAAARQLRISPNEIKQLDLKKKSVDARKKNDVRIIYTVDVVVKGREDKILKMAHCPKASAARDVPYRVPQPQTLPDSRPISEAMSVATAAKQATMTQERCRPVSRVPAGKNVPFFVRSGRATRNCQRPFHSWTASRADATSSRAPTAKRTISIAHPPRF